METLSQEDPRAIGEFRLRARLGSGGMGRVYLGMSPAGRAVAIKVLRPDLAEDQEFLQRFRHEVAAARAVSGIYTAPVVGAGLDGPQPWLATAFVPGPALEQVVTEHGPLPEAALWRLLAGLVEALQAIHACGVVHRDLKPANVLLATDGPHVIDFGISRAVDGTALTATGLAFGTPGYMSPEQAEGRQVGPASDVFALGCVLCCAATGAPPFGDGTAATVLYRIVHSEPLLDGMPARLRDVVAACLSKDPARRPALAALAAASASGTYGIEGSASSFWPPALRDIILGYQSALEGLGTRADGTASSDPHPPTQRAAPSATYPPTQSAGLPVMHPPAQSAAPSAPHPPTQQAAPAAGAVAPSAAVQQGYGPAGNARPGYGPAGYGQGAYPAPGYGQAPYPAPGYGQAPYPAPGYGQAPYPAPGYGQAPYPAPGYSQAPASPGAAGAWLPPRRPLIPASVRNAVALMYAGAVSAVALVVYAALTVQHIKASLNADPGIAQYQPGSSEAVIVSFAILGGVIEVGLWVWMAWANRKGRNWARITSTVFLAIDTLTLLISVFSSHTPGAEELLLAVAWAIGAASVTLLWHPQSSSYFKPAPALFPGTPPGP